MKGGREEEKRVIEHASGEREKRKKGKTEERERVEKTKLGLKSRTERPL